MLGHCRPSPRCKLHMVSPTDYLHRGYIISYTESSSGSSHTMGCHIHALIHVLVKTLREAVCERFTLHHHITTGICTTASNSNLHLKLTYNCAIVTQIFVWILISSAVVIQIFVWMVISGCAIVTHNFVWMLTSSCNTMRNYNLWHNHKPSI